MKTVRWMLLLVVGPGLSAPAIGRADTNHAHATQGDSTKLMKAFTKQQKKQQKQFKKAEKKAQKDAEEEGGDSGAGSGAAGVLRGLSGREKPHVSRNYAANMGHPVLDPWDRYC